MAEPREPVAVTSLKVGDEIEVEGTIFELVQFSHFAGRYASVEFKTREEMALYHPAPSNTESYEVAPKVILRTRVSRP